MIEIDTPPSLTFSQSLAWAWQRLRGACRGLLGYRMDVPYACPHCGAVCLPTAVRTDDPRWEALDELY